MTVGNTLLSGVNLEGGKLGYDTKKITSSKTWTSAGINIAAGTITGGIKMSGMSTSLVNGVAGGLSGGITTGDWKGSMVDSMRNSAAGYLGGNLGGGNDALTNVSSMLFRKMLGSKEDFSWDTVAQNDAIGKLVGGYLNEMLMSDEQKNARAADEQKRQQEQGSTAQGFKFMNMFENTIGGFFSQLGKDMDKLASDVGNAASGVKSAWGSIQSGEAWENIKTGAASAWEGVKGAANAVTAAVGNLAESAKNLFTEGEFATDDEVAEIQARQRIQEAIKNGSALEEGSEEYNRVMAALNGKPSVGSGSSQTDQIKQLNALDKQLNGEGKAIPETANSKAVQNIKDKLARGEAVSDKEINDFFNSSEMKSVERAGKENGSALEKELIETIKNDPKAFEEAMKAKKLDPNKPEDVQAFSRQMQASFCVLFSEYAQMTLNNVNGAAPSIGEFYKDLLNGKSSNGGKLIDVLNQKASTQEIFDSVAGKGNVKVYGYGQDRNGKGFSDGANDTGNYDGYDMMSKLDELEGDKSIKFITVRVNTGGNHYHDMTLRNGRDGFTLYDNSYRGKNISMSVWSKKYINLKTIKSLYYIR